MAEITITNYRKRRKFGWGWSTIPTGEDAYSIEVPEAPDYVGTLNQLDEARANDKAFHSLGGVFYNTAWFWNGKRITHTWAWAALESPVTPLGEWRENVKYGWRWVSGFEPRIEADIKIRVAD